jgi:PAS domain S-box-containing protein
MLDPSESKIPSFQKKRNADFSSLLSNPDNTIWDIIFDSMPEMIALIDLNNIVVKANKAMRQKVNVGDRSLIGHSCNNLMHDDGCTLSNCPHLSMINDRQPHTIEMFEPKFGLFLEISTTPLFDSDHNLLGSLHISRDISLHKESEAKLRKYNAELKELNNSKDKFFSIVAHDLRSPLQGMLGFTDLILDDLYSLSKEKIKDYLQKVRDSAYSIFVLLENLLDWSRMQTGRLEYKPSPFSLQEDLATVINLLDSNAQSKNIDIINNLNDEYIVFADRRMVHSILLNLLTNAIKFTFPGGSVIFNAKIIEIKENSSGNGTQFIREKYLEISVTDTGVGISPEGLIKIFNNDDPFTLAGTSNENGAGLGLKLVNEMTEKQGGKLTIASHEGKGSVFTFTLPLASEQ